MTAIFSFLFAVFLVFAVVNQFDESINPAINELKKNDNHIVSKENNAFYALLGLHIEDAEDIHAAGVTLATRYDDSKEYGSYHIVDIFPKDHKAKVIPLIRDESLCRYTKDQRCLQVSSNNPLNLIKNLETNSRLLSRYEDLVLYSEFYESIVSIETPWKDIYSLSQLYLLKLNVLAQEGKTDIVLRKLEKSLTFWQRVTASHISLLGKMIALGNMKAHYYFIADLYENNYVSSINQKEKMMALLQPLTAKQLSMCSAFEKEFIFGLKMLTVDSLSGVSETTSKTGTFLMLLGFLPNATANDLYHFYEAIFEACRTPIKQMKNAVKKIHVRSEELEDIFHPDKLFYNPTGKILTAIVIPNVTSYLVKSYELESLRRLVLIKKRIKDAHINAKSIPDFLAKLPVTLTNPYTGESVRYDVEKKDLFIEYDFDKPQRVSLTLK